MTPRKKKAEETALVPAEPGGKVGQQRRGKSHLMTVQEQWLQNLLETGSWRKACQALDPPITVRRVRGWLAEDPVFSAALDNLVGLDLDTTKKDLDALAAEAPGVYGDAIEAERGVRVKAKCPKCGHEFRVETMRPDWRIRLKGAETLLKYRKLLTETKEIKGGTINLHLTGDEAMAVLALQAGKAVPEAVLARLREKGVIP